MAIVQETKFPNHVEAKIEGASPEVDEAVEKYKGRYHPYGYGTRVKDRVDHADGTAVAVIRRRKSCH